MLKKNRNKILFVLVLMIIMMGGILSYIYFYNYDKLSIGIFYGSNWEVPGTEHYELLNQTIKKYNKMYPKIKVEYVEGIPSDDYKQWISGEIMKGDEPDIYIVLDDDFDTLASIGALKKLDPLTMADVEYDSEIFYKSVYDSGNYKGTQYALPLECNPTLMFVNMTILQEAGIEKPSNDWTWDDFYSICENVRKDSDGDGKIDKFGCYGYSWDQAVYSNGIQPFSNNGRECNFTEGQFVKAVNFVRDLVSLNDNYQVSSNDFDLGKVAFRPLTFSDYRTYMPYPWRIKKYSDFQWNCVTMPAGESGANISQMSTLMVAISSRTQKTKAAWQFLKILTTDEEIQSMIYSDTSGASALKSVTTSKETMELLNKDTPGGSEIDMSLLNQVMENAVVPKHFKNYDEAYEKTDVFIKDFIQNDLNGSTEFFNLKNQVEELLNE